MGEFVVENWGSGFQLKPLGTPLRFQQKKRTKRGKEANR